MNRTLGDQRVVRQIPVFFDIPRAIHGHRVRGASDSGHLALSAICYRRRGKWRGLRSMKGWGRWSREVRIYKGSIDRWPGGELIQKLRTVYEGVVTCTYKQFVRCWRVWMAWVFNDHDSKLKSKDCLVGGDFRFEDICSTNGCNKHRTQ